MALPLSRIFWRQRLIAVVLGGACLLALPALASSTPPAADPQRISPVLPETFAQELAPAPDSRPTTVDSSTMPEGAETITLTLTAVQLDGASAYPPDVLTRYWQALLGRSITLADVYALADQLSLHYRDDGYLMARVSVPAQEIADGKVRLQVDEGVIGSVEAQGDFISRPLVRKVIERVKQHQLLNIRRIEHELLLLNDLPGSTFRVVLVPAPDGKVGVLIIGEEDKGLSGNAQFDNSGSSYLGPYLASASLSVANLLAPLQQTSVNLSTTTQTDELNSASMSHVMPLGIAELLLTLDAAVTQGQPGASLKSSRIESHSVQFDIGLDYSLLRQRTDSLIFSAALSFRNSTTDVLDTRLSRDALRALRLGARYDWQDFLNGYNLTQLQLSRGLEGVLGGSATGDDDLSREEAHADFTKLELSLLRQQSVSEHISLFGALRAQISDAPLYSSEEFGFGGHFIGRAYDTSEKTGDSGISVLVEARYRTLEAEGLLLQPFVFADYGAVWNRDADQRGFDKGASVGAGIGLVHEWVDAKVMVAQPLINNPDSTYDNTGGPRLLFSMRRDF